MKKIVCALSAAVALLGLLAAVGGARAADDKPLRFVLIPKAVHPWFDAVNTGANAQARLIENATGHKVQIDYRAPQHADVVEQNDIIERAIATHPDGLLIDLLDAKANRVVIQEALDQKVPVTVFDSIAPEGMNLTSVGADFCEQARIASERLAKLLGGKGEVAIMMGVPTAPNHALRAQCHRQTLAKYPNIKIVATGIDNDSIETAQKQASAIMLAHPNLAGWVACDAAGPVGIGQAIRESGKTGTVREVGMDDLKDMLALIKEGVAESSSASQPQMEGAWAVMSAWQTKLGGRTPRFIDTGIAMITKDNVQAYEAAAAH